MTEIEEILAKIDDLKEEQRELTRKVTEKIMSFDGTIVQALEQGIVRLNFTALPGFHQMIRNRNRNK